MKHRTAIAVAAVFLVGVSVIFFRGSTDYSRVSAHFTLTRDDTGIPGLSTWYEAHLVNRGRFPVRIQICDFVDDTGSRGSMPAYSVQRFDKQTRGWQTVADASDVRSCHPYPLGWIRARMRTIWLLSNQELSTGGEITAARGFHKGDTARFVVYSGYRDSNRNVSRAFATSAFTIDEEIADAPSKFRIKH